MIYSKWDNKANIYHYYETPITDIDVGVVKAKLNPVNELGVAADDAGHDLPTNAKYVGYGVTAKGMIVKTNSTKGAWLKNLLGIL